LSIGFRPDWDKAVRLEKTNGWDFKESNLYEISIVPIPANSASVVQSKGITKALEDKVVDELEIKELELYLEDLIANLPEEPEVKEPEVKEPEVVEKETEVVVEKVIEDNFQTVEIEQTIKTLPKEDDIYSWLWDYDPQKEKDEEQDLFEKIYDLLGLTDSK
jgi:hypothetical protein